MPKAYAETDSADYESELVRSYNPATSMQLIRCSAGRRHRQTLQERVRRGGHGLCPGVRSHHPREMLQPDRRNPTRYTASNDVSSRHAQLIQSQWCHSKGFDTACPIGPCFVPRERIPDYKQLLLKGILRRGAEGEGSVMQESKLECVRSVDRRDVL